MAGSKNRTAVHIHQGERVGLRECVCVCVCTVGDRRTEASINHSIKAARRDSDMRARD